jgi:hypothetical protein
VIWTPHLICMINAHRILVGKLKGRDRLEDLGVDEKIILKCT